MIRVRLVSGCLVLAVFVTFAMAAQAAMPQQKTQVAGWYRFMLGDFEVTALSDGFLDLGTDVLQNVKKDEIQRGLARAFLPAGDKVEASVNAYLINTGSELILIDSGTGNLFGPTLGFVVENLKASGYDPAKVDKVLITHMHGDHLGGILTPDGAIAFPHAQIMPSQPESDYWLSESQMAKVSKEKQDSFRTAQKLSGPYRASGQWKPFAAGSQIIPGIRAIAGGHTPGHSSYLVESKGQQMIVLGDVIHFGPVQFPRPDISVAFDVDQHAAVAARKALFAQAAKDRTLLAGAHLSFPGVGHIRVQGAGYEWVPANFAPLHTAH